MNTKKIPLTKGRVATVDSEDFVALSKYKWYYQKHKIGYAVRNKRMVDGSRTTVRMHREILNAKRGEMIDHIDRNGLNNTKSNLRFCTSSQNLANSKKRLDNTSGHKGISKYRDKWQAQIKFQGRKIHLGYFESPKEAALAYNQNACSYFGKYARLE